MLLMYVTANGSSTEERAETETIKNGSTDMHVHDAVEHTVKGETVTDETQAKSTDTEANELPAKVPDPDHTNTDPAAKPVATVDKLVAEAESVSKDEEKNEGDHVNEGDEDTVIS